MKKCVNFVKFKLSFLQNSFFTLNLEYEIRVLIINFKISNLIDYQRQNKQNVQSISIRNGWVRHDYHPKRRMQDLLRCANRLHPRERSPLLIA